MIEIAPLRGVAGCGAVRCEARCNAMQCSAGCDVPLGCSKTPFSTPALIALLKSESNMLSVTVIELFARTYFFNC